MSNYSAALSSLQIGGPSSVGPLVYPGFAGKIAAPVPSGHGGPKFTSLSISVALAGKMTFWFKRPSNEFSAFIVPSGSNGTFPIPGGLQALDAELFHCVADVPADTSSVTLNGTQ